MNYLLDIKEIKMLCAAADHVGVKTVEADCSLEEFLMRMFTYRPQLVRLLYRVRAPMVRLLGFRQDPLPAMEDWIPEDFPMFPCEHIWFFTVRWVEDDHFWIAGCPRDRHLDADVGVVAKPLGGGRRRFHVVTVVRYKHWTGPVYFHIIRLFNLLLVNRMTHRAVHYKKLSG
jgi:hypothetical protein